MTLSTQSNFHIAGSTVDLNTSTIVAEGATVESVMFSAHYGTTGTTIGTVTAAPYNLRWSNVPAGTFTITATLRDSQNLGINSVPVTVTVGSNVAIQFASGLNGSTVDDDSAFVGSTTTAPPNSAVNVNGQQAAVTSGGQFFVNERHLQAGSNTATPTAIADKHQSARASRPERG